MGCRNRIFDFKVDNTSNIPINELNEKNPNTNAVGRNIHNTCIHWCHDNII